MIGSMRRSMISFPLTKTAHHELITVSSFTLDKI